MSLFVYSVQICIFVFAVKLHENVSTTVPSDSLPAVLQCVPNHPLPATTKRFQRLRLARQRLRLAARPEIVAHCAFVSVTAGWGRGGTHDPGGKSHQTERLGESNVKILAWFAEGLFRGLSKWNPYHGRMKKILMQFGLNIIR